MYGLSIVFIPWWDFYHVTDGLNNRMYIGLAGVVLLFITFSIGLRALFLEQKKEK